MPARPTTLPAMIPRVLLGLMIAMGFASVVHGLSIKAPQWKELVSQSDWVVRATVLQNKQTTLANKLPVIQTTFQTHTQYKGKTLPRFTIQILGGASGKYKIASNSLPRFALKSQVVLFLRSSKHTKFPLLVGLYHGVFDLDNSTNPPMIKHRGGKQPPQSLQAFEAKLKRSLEPKNQTLTTSPKNTTGSSTTKK